MLFKCLLYNFADLKTRPFSFLYIHFTRSENLGSSASAERIPESMKPWKEQLRDNILAEDEKIKTGCNEIGHICLRRTSCRARENSVRKRDLLSCSVNVSRSKNTLTDFYHPYFLFLPGFCARELALDESSILGNGGSSAYRSEHEACNMGSVLLKCQLHLSRIASQNMARGFLRQREI